MVNVRYNMTKSPTAIETAMATVLWTTKKNITSPVRNKNKEEESHSHRNLGKPVTLRCPLLPQCCKQGGCDAEHKAHQPHDVDTNK